MLTLYDEAGNVTFDGSRKVVKTLGTLRVGGEGSPQSGTVENPYFSLGRPFWIVLKDSGWYDGGGGGSDVEASIRGTTLTWRYPQAARAPATILYGIF